jgi:hypothetical protein
MMDASSGDRDPLSRSYVITNEMLQFYRLSHNYSNAIAMLRYSSAALQRCCWVAYIGAEGVGWEDQFEFNKYVYTEAHIIFCIFYERLRAVG